MGLKKKIARALSQALGDVYVQLSDDDRISGFVVSSRFKGMDALDRQQLINEVLQDPVAGLSSEEYGRVLMIAAVEPLEYHAVGAPVQISRVQERAGGGVDIVLHGDLSDADYVRKALTGHASIRTSAPKPVSGALGELVSFRAKGSNGEPLTRDKAIRLLRSDKYIEVPRKA